MSHFDLFVLAAFLDAKDYYYLEPPVISVAPSGVFDAREGERLRLTCSATGDPIPSVVWFKGKNFGLSNWHMRSRIHCTPPRFKFSTETFTK